MTDKKRVMDVTHPGKTPSPATARPVIVGHGAMLKDPMVVDADKPAEEVPAATPAQKSPLPRGKTLVKPLEPSAPEPAEDEDEDETPQKHPAATGETEAHLKQSETAEPEASEKPEKKEDRASADDEVSDTGVVDAVIDQVPNKKSAKDAEEEAKQAAIQKLITDKTYVVPISHAHRKGNKWLLPGLVFVIFAVVAGLYLVVDGGWLKPGFDVPYHIIGSSKTDEPAEVVKPASTLPVAKTQPATPTTTPTTADLAAYSSKSYGVTFSYPKAWGDVKETSIKGTSGKRVTLTFSSQPLASLGLMTPDYKENGKDFACPVAYGIFPESTIASLRPTAGVTSTKVTRLLKSTATILAYEEFNAADPDAALGSCPGLTFVGYNQFAKGSSYSGVQLVWGEKAADRKEMTENEVLIYSKTPDAYLMTTIRTQLLALLESARAQ